MEENNQEKDRFVFKQDENKHIEGKILKVLEIFGLDGLGCAEVSVKFHTDGSLADLHVTSQPTNTDPSFEFIRGRELEREKMGKYFLRAIPGEKLEDEHKTNEKVR